MSELGNSSCFIKITQRSKSFMKEISRNKVVWMVKIALEDTVSAKVVTFGDKLLPFQVHSDFSSHFWLEHKENLKKGYIDFQKDYSQGRKIKIEGVQFEI